MTKICVLGLGYIGLPTALLLAQHHRVIGVDINKTIVNQLHDYKIPFDEPGLERLFKEVKDTFSATEKIQEADVFIIAVPTPLNESLRIAELQFVKKAAEMIQSVMKQGDLIILESTVPPGASERLVLPILKKSGISEFSYAYCPERAIPGKTIFEMINNDRIIGGKDEQSREVATHLYQSFVKGSIHQTSVLTAEFVKLMENTYRDVNIALANEFALIFEENDLDVWEAIGLANKHPRVDILNPGPGVGGHCIAIDPWFLTENNTQFKLISVARQINDSMPNHVFRMIRSLLKGVTQPTITIFGVAYKADVDDTRLTPALKILMLAENEGYKIQVHDPHVLSFSHNLQTLDDAVEQSDCIVLLTDHQEYKSIDPKKIKEKMRTLTLLDTRNCLNHESWRKVGFTVKVL